MGIVNISFGNRNRAIVDDDHLLARFKCGPRKRSEQRARARVGSDVESQQ